MTAYVIAGLAQARHAGYEVNPEAMVRASKWMQARLASARTSPPIRARTPSTRWCRTVQEKALLNAAWDLRSKMSAMESRCWAWHSMAPPTRGG